MKALLKKDLRNAYQSLGPALLLGVPLLLIIYFAKSDDFGWLSGFWVTFFFTTTSLFYRSFGQENQSRAFLPFVILQVPRLHLFWSQALIHFLALLVMAGVYIGLSLLFFSPVVFSLYPLIAVIPLVALALAPLGTLLGLTLQIEREFLFAVIYLPLATPIFLAGYGLSGTDGPLVGSAWFSVLSAFILIGGFLSALLFKFFFDELSQTS